MPLTRSRSLETQIRQQETPSPAHCISGFAWRRSFFSLSQKVHDYNLLVCPAVPDQTTCVAFGILCPSPKPSFKRKRNDWYTHATRRNSYRNEKGSSRKQRIVSDGELVKKKKTPVFVRNIVILGLVYTAIFMLVHTVNKREKQPIMFSSRPLPPMVAYARLDLMHRGSVCCRVENALFALHMDATIRRLGVTRKCSAVSICKPQEYRQVVNFPWTR